MTMKHHNKKFNIKHRRYMRESNITKVGFDTKMTLKTQPPPTQTQYHPYVICY